MASLSRFAADTKLTTCRHALISDARSASEVTNRNPMARRPILVIPDAKLRQRAAPVAAVDDEVRALADDMFETMYKAPGIGLAAPQIGVLRRIVVLDVAKRRDEEATPAPMVLVNPEITYASQESAVHEEGCLSIPDFYEDVERPAVIRVRFLERDGKAA